jgi:hypothetical protein
MALPTGFALALCAAVSATNDPYEFILSPNLAYAQTFGPMVVALIVCGVPILAGRAAWLHGGTAALAALPLEIVFAMAAAAAAQFLGWRMTRRQAVAA